jgi:hypothetical protein
MNMNWKNARLLFAADGGDGSGGDNDDESTREAGFQRLADRYSNDGVAMARDLYRENYQVRRRNARLQPKALSYSRRNRRNNGLHTRL